MRAHVKMPRIEAFPVSSLLLRCEPRPFHSWLSTSGHTPLSLVARYAAKWIHDEPAYISQ